ncbi:Cache 3/Cache 2 fusion domain-containing protein [Breoghania sp. L-A4]|uniref:methyl-accepting chemotaxis protein n=1 Tax=Breoghania sp. L-A4 TaxID=2304600 RepID=UPI000E35BF7B|nr:Cache 3/Cache 2 fusion domain-containing protein [Breoghania sp. L-A4]AXS39201.1 methyl-accepting chemotaxis protein [Breoghania sp. L-A4]
MKFNVSRLRISTAMTVVSVIMIAASISAIGLVVYSIISDKVREQATDGQNASLRVAATILERTVDGVNVSWGKDGNVEKIVVDQFPDFEEHSMIDTVGRMTGETATVFQWDPESRDFWRKTTNIVKPDGKRAVGTPLGQKGAVYPVLTGGKTFRGEAVILGLPYYTIYQPIFSKAGEVTGILYAGVKKDEINAIIGEILGKLAFAFVIVLAVSGTLSVFISRILLKPLPVLSAITQKIANDDFEADLPYTERSDEIGELAKSVRTFQQRGLERVAIAAEQASDRAASEQRQKRTEQLIDGFRNTVQGMIDSVEETAHGMEETARALTDIARESAGQASETAAASEEATGNVETVASAAEELSSSISEISRQVGQTTEIVGRATIGAQSTNEKISSLANAANKIGEVIGLIQDIAEQTNLLALNATIEAARAGEMGKGFAVVASEVKELATQTSKATEEIGAQIAAIQSSTTEAVEAIGEITRTMDEVNGYTSAIASAVQEQGAATVDISRNVQQAAQGTVAVTGNMATLSQAVAQTNASAEDVLNASTAVTGKTDQLRQEINHFLQEVSAA